MSWFEIKDFDKILTPALLFYPDRIKSNIQEMLRIAGNPDRLRPHVKTYKCKEIVQLQLDAGVSKFKCATLTEAQMLADLGVKDILIAYPLIGPAQKKIIELGAEFRETKFSVLVDHADQLTQWEKITNSSVSIFMDLNVGMNRTGISPENAFELIHRLDGQFQLKGLHVYDGHIHDRDPKERTRTTENAFSPVTELINSLKDQGTEIHEIVCGGSITFPIHAEHPERTLSPGTTLLWDQGYSSNFPDLKFDIGAVLLTRIISKPGENLISLDAGHKAIASEMTEPSLFFPQIPDAQFKTHSEEHLVIEVKDGSKWNIGDVLYGIPWHICPTVALHESALIVDKERIVDQWNIVARNRIYT